LGLGPHQYQKKKKLNFNTHPNYIPLF
jgi:hypothetical protein